MKIIKSNKKRRFKLTILLYFFLLPGFFSCSNIENNKWISLFNGKDLTGWKIKISGHDLGDNYKNTFRVENGILKVSYDNYEKFDSKFGHIFYDTKL